MSRTIGILGALHGPDEVAFVTAAESLAPGAVLVRRCGDVPELLAAAQAGLGRIAVVSADLPGLDREAVSELLAAGVRTVALADPPEGWLAERTRALGIAVVVAPDGAVDAVAREAASLRAGGDGPTADTGRRARQATDSAAVSGGTSPSAGEPELGAGGGEGAGGAETDWSVAVELLAQSSGEEAARPETPGRVVAVWGPTGAPGRTTVAVNLAAELAALRSGADGEVLLVDADTYGGTVGQVLGLLDEAPGIAAAARAAGQGTLDRTALALLAPVVAPGLRVVTGISRAARWAEVPGPALDNVWDVARTLATWTVVDCGFGVEDDEALSYDTRAPRRNAATLSALAAADLVVVVGAADPIGVQRLVRALGDLDGVGVPGSRVVLANRLRATAVGPRPADLVGAALERYAGVGDVRFVPDDRAALDTAVLRGVALREVATGSPARKAFAALAADLEKVRAAQSTEPAATRRSGRRAAARS
ncbi:MAG: hypothetical protein GX593_06050 [Actinomycetales bacterium]|nr:hypothetical protein [Actinomycetales bacterium]